MAMCLAMMSGVDPIIVRKVFNYVNLRCTFYVMVTSPLTILRPSHLERQLEPKQRVVTLFFLILIIYAGILGPMKKVSKMSLVYLDQHHPHGGYLLRKDDQMKHTRKYSQQNQWFTYGHSLIRICM